MDKAQFYQGLVATLIAARERRQAGVTNQVDKQCADFALALCTPLETTRSYARTVLLESMANLPPDQQECSMPLALECASMIDGYVEEFYFRKMLSGWSEPDSAEFRQKVLARLNLGAAGFQEQPT